MEYRNISFVVADDQSIVKFAIKSIIEKDKEFNLMAEANNSAEAYRFVRKHKPDILITDIYLKGDKGSKYIQGLKKINPLIKIIVLSDRKELDIVCKAFELGVHSYMLKSCQINEIETAIQKVIAGDKYFTKDVKRIISSAKKMRKEGLEDTSRKVLSKREIEILKLIATGQTSNQIAKMLFISTRTVDAHRSNMMTKLRVKNAAELLGVAYRNQLIDPRPVSS
ncbi:MAG: response regulator transcription factor [Flavobacteriales bacterium]|nr:response regulator transcription factor [Flavobacteriales bacterium]